MDGLLALHLSMPSDRNAAGTNLPESTRNMVTGLVLLGAVVVVQHERG